MKTTLLILALLTEALVAENNQSQATALPDQATAKTKSLISQTTNTSWVDQKIEEIKPQRKGLNTSSLATMKSPFIIVKKKVDPSTLSSNKVVTSTSEATKLLPTKKDMSKEPLTLQIVLNTSALINGSWLKENDSIRGYKLTQIQNNHVVLERKNKKIKLFITQKNDNINISTK